MASAADDSTRGPGPRRARPRLLPPVSMTVRLWVGLAVFVLLLLTASALVFDGAHRQDHTVDTVVSGLQPMAAANLRIRADFADAQSTLRAYLLTRETRFLALYGKDRTALDQALRHAATRPAGTGLALIRSQQQTSATWFGYASRMLAVPPAGPGLAHLTDAAYPSAGAFYRANTRLNALLQRASASAVRSGEQAERRANLIGGSLAALAVLLGLAAVVGTIRVIGKPLRGLVRVLERLTSGEQAVRATVAGPREIRNVASSLNELMNEGDRFREREAESNRLRAMAREAGIRIREHLRVEDLVQAARQAIEENFGADVAYLHVFQDGRLSLPLGHEDDWVMGPGFLALLERQESMAMLEGVYRERGSVVIQDVGGPDGERLPRPILDSVRAAGIVSQVVVPFGSGAEILGLIAVLRTHPGRPWSGAEVDAIESIAHDLGRGLHHARLYEAENRLVAELRAVDQAKSDFLATVSHELRTPLTSIAGYLEILRDREAGPLTAAQEQMLDTVERNALRLRHLIEDVLTLSKIESGAFNTTLQPVDLGEIITSAVRVLQPAVAAKGLELTAGDAGDAGGDLFVAGDPGQLDRLVMNLLSNAVKFTPEGGRVEIRAASDGTMAVLKVADTGIGIPAGDQKALFSRFFRATNAIDRSIPGTGLGLTIVRTIVANHGGDMRVRSQEGDGTSVTVRIPLLIPAARPSPEGRPG